MVNLHFNGSPVISFSLRYTNLSRRINQKCLKVLDTLKATPTFCIVKNIKRERWLANNEVWELEKLEVISDPIGPRAKLFQGILVF